MIGAIAGDIIGSVYEFHQTKQYDFPLFGAASSFTDDTVMTIAVADSILHGSGYADSLRKYGHDYPDPMGGYGGMFVRWLADPMGAPNNSFGNGSAMRVSPVGFAFGSIEKVLEEAEKTAAVSHSHPEGIKGARAVAAAVFLARQGREKDEIRKYIADRFGYDLSRTVDEIRPGYRFDDTCQGTVPQAIIAFLDSTGYEDAVRKAVSLGGDADTLGCITGGIAEACYRHIPAEIVAEVRRRLDARLLAVLDAFEARFGVAAR